MNVLNGDLVWVLLPGNQGSHAQSDLPWRGLPPATPPPAEPALVAHHESLLRPATIPRARVAEPRRKAGFYQTYFSHHPPFRVVRSTPRRRVPLTDLGLTLTPGQKLRADLGGELGGTRGQCSFSFIFSTRNTPPHIGASSEANDICNL